MSGKRNSRTELNIWQCEPNIQPNIDQGCPTEVFFKPSYTCTHGFKENLAMFSISPSFLLSLCIICYIFFYFSYCPLIYLYLHFPSFPYLMIFLLLFHFMPFFLLFSSLSTLFYFCSSYFSLPSFCFSIFLLGAQPD